MRSPPAVRLSASVLEGNAYTHLVPWFLVSSARVFEAAVQVMPLDSVALEARGLVFPDPLKATA